MAEGAGCTGSRPAEGAGPRCAASWGTLGSLPKELGPGPADRKRKREQRPALLALMSHLLPLRGLKGGNRKLADPGVWPAQCADSSRRGAQKWGGRKAGKSVVMSPGGSRNHWSGWHCLEITCHEKADETTVGATPAQREHRRLSEDKEEKWPEEPRPLPRRRRNAEAGGGARPAVFQARPRWTGPRWSQSR